MRRLLTLAAASSRGQQESASQRGAALSAIEELEGMNPTPEPARSLEPGPWTLVYASVEAFRASPFFWGFQKAVPGGEGVAAQVFRFTAGLPVAGTRGPFGRITQAVDLAAGEMESDVEMRVFDPFFALASGIAGTVVSRARVAVAEGGAGDTLLVTPASTRVRDSNLAGALLDRVVVPTDQLQSAANGGEPVVAECRVTYADGSLRVMRVGDRMDQVFVFARDA